MQIRLFTEHFLYLMTCAEWIAIQTRNGVLKELTVRETDMYMNN